MDLFDRRFHLLRVASHACDDRETPAGPELDRQVADVTGEFDRLLGVLLGLLGRPSPQVQERERPVHASEQAGVAEPVGQRQSRLEGLQRLGALPQLVKAVRLGDEQSHGGGLVTRGLGGGQAGLEVLVRLAVVAAPEVRHAQRAALGEVLGSIGGDLGQRRGPELRRRVEVPHVGMGARQEWH